MAWAGPRSIPARRRSGNDPSSRLGVRTAGGGGRAALGLLPEPGGIAAGFLGSIESFVGPPEQFGGTGAGQVREGRHTNAGRHRDGISVFVDPELLDCRAKTLGKPHRRGDFAIRGNHHELLASVTGDEVARADYPGQGCGRLAQHGVTGRMPVAIVDRLEMIEIRDHHRQRSAAAAAGRPLPGKAIVKDTSAGTNGLEMRSLAPSSRAWIRSSAVAKSV